MTDERAPVLTGGCQCGAVRYTLFAAPEGVHICHCRMCQKAVGGPFAPLAPIRKSDFEWSRGTPAGFASSSIAARDFCSACGTPLSFRYIDSDWIDVTIGSLDLPEKAPPRQQYGTENRLGWFAELARLPGEATNLTPEQQARIVNFQHPDHKTDDDWRPPHRAGNAL